MAGLILACVFLVLCTLALSMLLLRYRRRIRAITRAAADFTVRSGKPMDVALEEDDVAALQNAIGQLQHALLRAQEQRQEEYDRTSHLTADIAHQLKTPLTTLRLYTELDAAPHMEGALEQITRMENLIQSLLRLERLCAGGYRFTFREQDIRALTNEQWDSLHALYPDRTLQIVGNAHIRCDGKWLGEAIANLLKNACEHTASQGTITVKLEQTNSAFFCTVEDNGGGVSQKDLPHLFERFYRAENSDPQGAGIGLSIVREIVRRHHGIITAENTDLGLRMTITMPILDMNLANS